MASAASPTRRLFGPADLNQPPGRRLGGSRMEYKHRRRKEGAAVHGRWTPTYYGDNLELQLKREDPYQSEREAYQAPFTKRPAMSGKEREGYGAIISPVNSVDRNGAVGAAGSGGGGAAGMLDKYHQSYSEQRLRARSAPRGAAGVDDEGGKYGSLNSPRRKQKRGMLRSRSRSKSRSKSVDKQRTKSAGKQRAATPNKDGGRKGWGGFLRRKKKHAGHEMHSSDGGNVCDYCQRTVCGKTREEMYQRLEFAYCSTECTRSHQKALDAEEDRVAKREVAIGNANEAATMAFAEGGFGSPPITPSAALLPGNDGENDASDERQGNEGRQERQGRQFFPSTVATATASEEEHMFDHNNWFHPAPPPGEQIGSVGGHSRSRSNSWSQTSKAPSTIRIDYGRGISDEYRDYNDELSRQLRLAARQDELENEEKRYQKRQFINEHCSPGRRRGGVPAGVPTGVAGLPTGVADASPGRYGRQRKKHHPPPTKPNENATQSTESISSSSYGGFSNPASVHRGSIRGGGGDGVSPLPEAGTLNISPQRSQQSNNSSKASWGYLDVGGGKDLLNDSWAIHSREDLAFGGLGNWPPSDGVGGADTEDDGFPVDKLGEGRTPKMKNLRAGSDSADEATSRRNSGGDNSSSKDYQRQVSSLSNASPMQPISEEQNFGGDNNDFPFFAQKRDVPPAKPSRSKARDAPRSKKSSKKAVIESVEDVVSVVSYYDDPSLTSLATNDDTITTRSSFVGRGRRGSPTGGILPGSIRKDKKAQRSADPPGESIDDLLRHGIHRGMGGSSRREHFLQHGRDPSFQELHPPDPSYQGLEPEDTTGFSPQRRMLGAHLHSQHQSKPSPQGYPQQQQQQTRRDAAEQSPGIEPPHDEEFDVDKIEFEMNDDASMGMLTGEEDGGPSLDLPRGDDDTATGTLDTVDLVAEVKRVWRHVQRYEQKKHHKKRSSSKQGKGQGNAQLDVSNLTSVDEDAVADTGKVRDESPISSMMGPLVERIGGLQVQPGHQHHDGASNFSDITPSSSHHLRGRGRSRTPDGRLGKHIRSTSAHSRQHTPVPDSPGMDSDHAMASRTSTERDVHFLNEGVDAFYDGQGQKGEKDRAQAAKPQQALAQDQRTRRQTLSRLQRTSPNTLQRLSQSPPKYKGKRGLTAEEHLLAKPYDMNKVKSTGTSFTQKTEKASNLASSPLTSSMAHKYLRHREYSSQQHASPPNPATSRAAPAGASPNLYERYRQRQPQPRQQQQQPPKQRHARAESPLMRHARDRRTSTSRVS